MKFKLNEFLLRKDIAIKNRKLLTEIQKSDSDLEIEIENVDEIDFVKSIDEYLIENNQKKFKIKTTNQRSLYYALKNLKNKNEKIITLKTNVKVRSYMLDISRGKIPSKLFFENLVSFLSENYINELQIYIEPNYKINSNYWLKGLEEDFIEWLQLLCSENFIELVPAIATFSHLYDLVFKNRDLQKHTAIKFSSEKYYFSHKMEHYTLDPFQEKSWEITKSILDFTLKNFKSKKINVCCDEPFDLTTNEFKNRYSLENWEDIYFEYSNKIANYVIKENKIPQIWADVFCKNNSPYISKFNKEVQFLNWNYNSLPNTDQFKNIDNANYKQILCPSDTGFGVEFLNYNNAFSNIENIYNYHQTSSFSEGIMLTHWGDYGHLNSIVQGLPTVEFFSKLVFGLKSEIFDLKNPYELIYLNLNSLKIEGYRVLIQWMEQEQLYDEFKEWEKQRDNFFKGYSAFKVIDRTILINQNVDLILKNWGKINILPKFFNDLLKDEVDIMRDFCIVNNNLFLTIMKNYYQVEFEYQPIEIDEIKRDIENTFNKWMKTQSIFYKTHEISLVKEKYIELANFIKNNKKNEGVKNEK